MRGMFLFCVLLTGCVHSVQYPPLSPSQLHNLDGPKITYLGVGGWLIRWEGDGVLIAPSFSNPAFLGIKKVPPLFVSADEERIDRDMPDARDVSMLLVGHAHYDHLLDVPRVLEKQAPNATVYGSETVGHILHAMPNPKPFVPITKEVIARVNKPDEPGKWFDSRSGLIRAMPIESMHAGHIAGINLIKGEYRTDRKTFPVSVFGWPLGQISMAWLVDLRDREGRTVYRIHFQDAAAQPPYGFPPNLPDGKRIDVEILCSAGWNQVSDYPRNLLQKTKPRLVLLGHWENFFGNEPGDLEPVPGYNPYPLLRITKVSAGSDARVVLPAPMSEVALPPAESGELGAGAP